MTPEPSDVIAEGRAAFRAGVHHSANPHKGWAYYEWRRGWKQAKAEPPPPPEPTREEQVVVASKRHHAIVAQFERAVAEHEFIGTIPLYSEDADEQRRINAERRRLVSNLTKTRNNLLRELAREPKFSLKD
jgi:hypothetical protein